VESLSHFMFDCPATSAQRDDMFAEIRSLPGCAEKLRSVLSMADSSIKVLRFVSDDIWGSSGRCLMVSPCIAAFLVKSWDGCGAVLASAVHAETELQDALLVLLLFGAAALLQNAKQQHARVCGSVLHSWMLYTPHVEMHWQQQLQHVNTRVAYTASQMHW
ncbi:hypothetical protein COO60DRAFT_1534458, partial [Scenedesmus sp. NREL 46B-D3]